MWPGVAHHEWESLEEPVRDRIVRERFHRIVRAVDHHDLLPTTRIPHELPKRDVVLTRLRVPNLTEAHPTNPSTPLHRDSEPGPAGAQIARYAAPRLPAGVAASSEVRQHHELFAVHRSVMAGTGRNVPGQLDDDLGVLALNLLEHLPELSGSHHAGILPAGTFAYIAGGASFGSGGRLPCGAQSETLCLELLFVRQRDMQLDAG